MHSRPGGEIEHDETFSDGINRCLNNYLCANEKPIEWKITDIVSKWYRSNAEPAQFPYLPPHITSPKEEKYILLIEMLPNMNFVVPKNYKLVAAPFFELYNNSDNYGNVISSIPNLISRYDYHFMPTLQENE